MLTRPRYVARLERTSDTGLQPHGVMAWPDAVDTRRYHLKYLPCLLKHLCICVAGVCNQAGALCWNAPDLILHLERTCDTGPHFMIWPGQDALNMCQYHMSYSGRAFGYMLQVYVFRPVPDVLVVGMQSLHEYAMR